MFALSILFSTYSSSTLLKYKLAISIVHQIVIYHIFNSIPFYISSLVLKIIAYDTTYIWKVISKDIKVSNLEYNLVVLFVVGIRWIVNSEIYAPYNS